MASGCSVKALMRSRKFKQTALSYFNIPKNAKFYFFPMKIDSYLLHSDAFYAIINLYHYNYRTGV